MTRPAVNRYAVADASLPMRRTSKVLSFALVVALNRYFRRENGAPEKRHLYVLCALYCPLHAYIPLFYNSLMYLL
jgi:hypothetical protein